METKKILVLIQATKAKVIEATVIHKLIKQTVTKFNAEQTQVYEILKEKSGVRSQSLHCSNGSMKHKLWKLEMMTSVRLCGSHL